MALYREYDLHKAYICINRSTAHDIKVDLTPGYLLLLILSFYLTDHNGVISYIPWAFRLEKESKNRPRNEENRIKVENAIISWHCITHVSAYLRMQCSP